MSKPNMEDLFRNRFEDFSPELPTDRWPGIKARLDKKKRRRMILFFTLGFALLAGTIAIINSNKTTSLVVSDIPLNSEEQNNQQERRNLLLAKDAETSNTKDVKEYNPGSNSTTPDISIKNTMRTSGSPDRKVHFSTTSKNETTVKPDANANLAEPGSTDDKNTFIGTIENEIITPVEPEASIPETGEFTMSDPLSEPEPAFLLPLPVKDRARTNTTTKKARQHTWDIGLGFNFSYSVFEMKMPSDIGSYPGVTQEMVKENYRLRKGIEKGGFSVSQSLFAAYRFSDNWSVTTGVSLIQTTQVQKFTLVPARDHIAGPSTYDGQGNHLNNSSYQFVNDSVVFGNGINRHNNYYSREIPVFVNYERALNKTFGFVGTLGVSYRYLASGNIYFPDVDNVGLVYLSSKNLFPGFQGTFTLHAGAGIRWNISDYVHLQVMPTFQYGLQSNIRFDHWVQQFQRQAGLQLRLNRTITFTK